MTQREPETPAVGPQVDRGVRPRRAQQVEQRERIPSARKKTAKPWVACWKWGPKQKHIARNWFATKELADAYVEKQKRSYGRHPNTGKAWGPCVWWVEGPNFAINRTATDEH